MAHPLHASSSESTASAPPPLSAFAPAWFPVFAAGMEVGSGGTKGLWSVHELDEQDASRSRTRETSRWFTPQQQLPPLTPPPSPTPAPRLAPRVFPRPFSHPLPPLTPPSSPPPHPSFNPVVGSSTSSSRRTNPPHPPPTSSTPTSPASAVAIESAREFSGWRTSEQDQMRQQQHSSGTRLSSTSFDGGREFGASIVGGGGGGAKVTRYVLIRGVKKDSSEQELRKRFINPFPTLKSCSTSLLRSNGIVVLVFNDLRDAIAALRSFDATTAECVEREIVQSTHPSSLHPSLLSSTEGRLHLIQSLPQSTTATPLPMLSTFGELRSFQPLSSQGGQREFVAEYWDDHAAEKARGWLDGRFVGVREGGEGGEGWWEVKAERRSSHETASAKPSGTYSPPYDLRHVATTRETSYQPLASMENTLVRPLEAVVDSHPSFLTTQQLPAGGLTDPQDVISKGRSVGGKDFSSSSMPPGLQNIPVSVSSPPPPPVSPVASTRSRTVPPTHGIYREDKIPAHNVIDFGRIEQGLDVRTTLMLKNIPNKLKDTEVMEFIDEVVGRSYSFFYCRVDFNTGSNVGYAFVDFVSTDFLLRFARARLGTRWNMGGSDKLCMASYANIQGKDSLINHFKNSSVLDQDESRRPKLFVSSGPNRGEPEPFPPCDDPLRKARSAANAQSIGLFPANKPVFKVTKALKSMHI